MKCQLVFTFLNPLRPEYSTQSRLYIGLRFAKSKKIMISQNQGSGLVELF